MVFCTLNSAPAPAPAPAAAPAPAPHINLGVHVSPKQGVRETFGGTQSWRGADCGSPYPLGRYSQRGLESPRVSQFTYNLCHDAVLNKLKGVALLIANPPPAN